MSAAQGARLRFLRIGAPTGGKRVGSGRPVAGCGGRVKVRNRSWPGRACRPKEFSSTGPDWRLPWSEAYVDLRSRRIPKVVPTLCTHPPRVLHRVPQVVHRACGHAPGSHSEGRVRSPDPPRRRVGRDGGRDGVSEPGLAEMSVAAPSVGLDPARGDPSAEPRADVGPGPFVPGRGACRAEERRR